MSQRIRQYQLGIYMKLLESERGSAYGFQGMQMYLKKVQIMKA